MKVAGAEQLCTHYVHSILHMECLYRHGSCDVMQ